MLEIDLTEVNRTVTSEHSSKGNQPKWHQGEYWYKADHMGYESLSEILVSRLLDHSNLDSCNYVTYEPVIICVEAKKYTGCRSRNFQGAKESLIPLERLYRTYNGHSLAEKLAEIQETADRIRFTVDFVERTTSLTEFGSYVSTLLVLDALTLNEDRHTNNIAVLRNEKTDRFRLCPIFDNGLAFLSDRTDYPFEADLFENISRVKAKPFSQNFPEQAEAVTMLYGDYLHFHLKSSEIGCLFADLAEYYPAEIRERAERILREQMRKHKCLFD